MTTVTIPYSPRQFQKTIHSNLKRWSVIVAHRRFGKSVLGINEGIKRIFITKLKNPRVGFIAPTYRQAKLISWDYLKYYSRPIPGAQFNESELRVDYPNGGRFQLFGADNPDSLRGMYFDYVIFDEYSQQPPNIFTEIIRPALTDREGGAMWIGTPKGKNDFHKLYKEAVDEDWYRVLLKVSETKLISDKELKDAQKTMTPEEYQQEFECSFLASIKGAYYSSELEASRASGHIRSMVYDKTLPVHTVWDLGVADDTAIGFYQTIAGELRMIDFYHNNGVGLDYYIQVLKDKGYQYGTHFAPHDIEHREFSNGKSRKEIALALGIDFEKIPNIHVTDGINAGRMIFNRLWIDEVKCAYFLDALIQYRRDWDEKNGMFKDKPLHDWTSHAADVHRYFALVADQMRNESYKTKQYRPKISNSADKYFTLNRQ